MSLSKWLLRTAAFVGVLGASASAGATGGFPGALMSDLGLSYRPPCSICHGSAGGGGPMVKPFGVAMQERGLLAGNEQSLQTALSRMEADQVDSDGDGVPDVTQLRAGLDPNTGLTLTGPEPTYGCGGTIAPQPQLHHTAWMAAGMVAAVFAWQLRRRRKTGR